MKINQIVNYLNEYIPEKPKICVVLGSGLNSFKENLNDRIDIPYKNIPGFLTTSVRGHEGMFMFSYIGDTPILCANGRFHYYEGYTFEEVGSIMKIFKVFNPNLSIITNSSGCLKLDWNLGDFMLIKNFLDFSFIDSFNPKLYKITKTDDYKNILKIAKKNKIVLHEGTYAYTMGPSYETEAEINEIIHFKGDAVGMSTFPEFLMCQKEQLNAVFIACLTNYGAGLIKNQKVNHSDVLKGANKSSKNFEKMIISIIENIGHQRKQKK
mgnify:CR=1 FL=1